MDQDLIFFSSGCTYWTNKPTDHCPVCKSICYSISEKAWEAGIKKRDKKIPGWRQHIMDNKETCL